jgi:germacradienol/geosmin synthase
MGMFESVPGLAEGAVWDERRFRGFDFAHCAAMIHADAAREQLDLSADWLAWGTYGDDYFPLVFGARRDVVAAKACDDRLALFMPLDGDATPGPTNAVERGLADLWRRTAGPMSDRHRATFRKAVRDMTSSWVWEVGNQAQHRVPDPVDYVEMRRRTFGSDLTMSLTRLAHDPTDDRVIPEELHRTRVLRELDTAAQDYACFLNDLFSYQKEVQFEGEIHNIVVVVETFLGVDRYTARDIVARLMDERMAQFRRLSAEGIPAMVAELGLTDEEAALVRRHAVDLEDWMSGILEWHRTCVRYAEADLYAERNREGVGWSPPTGHRPPVLVAAMDR